MKKLFLILAFVVASLSVHTAPTPSYAQFDGCAPGFCSPPTAVATCTEAGTFLARTSGLDATHINAYTSLICGLVTDGVWAKLDVFYVYATQDTTTAQLNLVSTSFPATLHGAPTFTADRGYTGVDASTTVFIDTGFNPTTAPSPKYTQNSAHISEWNFTNSLSLKAGEGSVDAGQLSNTYILPRFTSDNSAYFRVNVGINGGSQVVVGSADGHYIANRISSSAVDGYKTGSVILSAVGQTSVAPNNLNFYNLSFNFNGAASGVGHQIGSTTIGSTLTGGQPLALYTRERAYMTAVGAP